MNTGKWFSKSTFALFAFLFAFPQVVFAAGFVTMGSSPSVEGGSTVSSGQVFSLQVEADRSYACTVLGDGTGTNLDLSDTLSYSGGTLTGRFTGNMTPVVTEEGTLGDNRLSFTPTVSGLHTMTLTNAESGGENAKIECQETTLYGGYNTNVSDFNFLELLNTTNDTVTALVTAINFDGTVVIDQQSVSIAANRRADVDIHTAAGANKFGLIMVSHNGPFGALQGRVSMYSGTTSSFTLDASVDLNTREQVL
ncbi:MAG: hypothetical protein IT291_05145 [Deltaproteobacteria bacterium]|nr:hypothetical protein [Deltaproteobacteria bacterium]